MTARPVGLVPLARVADVAASIEWYERIGFRLENTFEEGGVLNWAYLARDGAHLMLGHATEPVTDRQAVLFYLYADDVAAYHCELGEQGVEVGPLEPRFYMENGEFRISDPDGYTLLVGEQ
jgi:catechol 2,3-dioxygenase-like lactoylglutathione lyase family enzyme